ERRPRTGVTQADNRPANTQVVVGDAAFGVPPTSPTDKSPDGGRRERRPLRGLRRPGNTQVVVGDAAFGVPPTSPTDKSPDMSGTL
ncbi:MAG: hypothetical protein LBG78_10050, partial [Azoarcus sp.]|nr:hypothetical protein [Azoarcus sp.]